MKLVRLTVRFARDAESVSSVGRQSDQGFDRQEPTRRFGAVKRLRENVLSDRQFPFLCVDEKVSSDELATDNCLCDNFSE